MSIELLLAHADGKPFIEGLPDDAFEPSKHREAEDDSPLTFRTDFSDPNILEKQRWGVIVPDGSEGERLAQIIAPLIATRKDQQEGHEPKVYKVPTGMSAEQAIDWWGKVYNSEDTDIVDRPRYLLILGDADQISWDAQQCWSSAAYVGRLAFANESGYEAYMHKLLACERAARAEEKKLRSVFLTVRDGTAATTTGHRGLMSPTIDALREGLTQNTFAASEIVDLGENGRVTPEDFLRAAALHEPTLLFSVSHGFGTTQETSEQERRRIQGAMSFGQGVKLTAEDVANRAFLPGGAWFFFACFSAGTPSESSYAHWLQSLKEAGMNVRQSDIDGVFAALAQQKPFVAALPQAALANPDGPLAVMGHVDLAWTFSFQDGSKQFKSSRFHNVFRGIVEHARVGSSFFDLQRVFVDVNGELTTMFDQEAKAQRTNKTLPDAKTRALKKASLWMLRQDLTAYVLLGDPAARITASASPEEVRKVPSIVTKSAAAKPDTEMRASASTAPTDGAGSPGETPEATGGVLASMDPAQIEAVVFATVGDAAMDAAAKHFGASRPELDAWVKAYKEGGRAAVRAKPNA
jgi:hypothetical protein